MTNESKKPTPHEKWSQGQLKDHEGWGSFYSSEIGECDRCGDTEHPVQENADDPGWYLCVRCHVQGHADSCDCLAWVEAETDFNIMGDRGSLSTDRGWIDD